MSGDAGLWAFDLCTVYPLPGNRVLVRNPRNARHAVLMPDVYQTLLDCREFRTLDEHARRLAARHPGLTGQEATVRDVLERVRTDGLMLSADIYPHLFGPNPSPGTLTDRAVVAVITWERPEALARCLDSAAGHCDPERIERLFVIDDSRTGEARDNNRSVTEDFAGRASVPVHYVGAEEQRQFMERIIRELPAHEDSVRFLIDAQRWEPYWSSGRARSLALLLGAGRRLLVLDDDIVCEVFEPFTRSGAVRFSGAVREAAFFEDDREWREFRATRNGDPFARHLRVLGLGLPDALGALGLRELGDGALRAAPLGFLEQLRADSPVLISECGTLGDPGTSRSNWLTGLEGDSLDRLLASDATVAQALDIRNCWNGRSHAHFGPHANMSPLTGLDNRRMLPPYIPILRGEDRLFASMVAFLNPGSVVVDHAWAVPHLPIPRRRWTTENRAFDTREPFPYFILSLVAENLDISHSRDPMRRLAHLAGLWENLADLDHEHMREHYVDRLLETRARHYNHLKALRAQCAQAPRAWLDYLDEALGRLNREMIDNPVETRLRGYPPGLEDERLCAWWQDFFRRFGHAIRAWPAIRHVAGRISSYTA